MLELVILVSKFGFGRIEIPRVKTKIAIFPSTNDKNRFGRFLHGANCFLQLGLAGFSPNLEKNTTTRTVGSWKCASQVQSNIVRSGDPPPQMDPYNLTDAFAGFLSIYTLNTPVIYNIQGFWVHSDTPRLEIRFHMIILVHILSWFVGSFLIKSEPNYRFHHQLQMDVTRLPDGVGWHSSILGLCTLRDTLIPGL